MNEMFNDFDSTRCYTNLLNLTKAIEKFGFTDCNFLVVKIPFGKNEGKLTAVFPITSKYGTSPAFEGFKVMG